MSSGLLHCNATTPQSLSPHPEFSPEDSATDRCNQGALCIPRGVWCLFITVKIYHTEQVDLEVTLHTCIREVPGSNFALDTGYPD
jgi:hypothetical protein